MRDSDRSTDATAENEIFLLDPAYTSDDGEIIPEVWTRSDRLSDILESEELPDDDTLAFLRDEVQRQIPTVETFRSVTKLLMKHQREPTLSFFVILFPGEARDNTGLKDLNDKVLGYQLSSEYFRSRWRHIREVFGGDFSVVGQNYKSANILTLTGSRKDFDLRLEELDGKLRKTLLELLERAERKDDGTKRDEIRKLRRVLLRDKKYRFDIYYGTTIYKIHGSQNASWYGALQLAFIGLTESLKGAGISRYVRKGENVPRLISRFARAARHDKGFDKRGKEFKSRDYLKVVTQAGDLKEFITKPVSKDHKFELNIIWVETIWTRAFFKRRRRFFPNPDVVRAVRKRWLRRPKAIEGNIKFSFSAQRAALELWLVVLNTLDFIKSFLLTEFSTLVLDQHRTAAELLDGLDEKPPKVDWPTMRQTLTRDFGSRPIARFGKASEYIFFSEVANEPEWIFFSMDARDLGVALMLLYEDSNEEIEDRKLFGRELLYETFKSSDPIIRRMRFTYDRVVLEFEENFFNRVRLDGDASGKAAAAFGKDVHGRRSTPGDSPVAVRIMLGGDEIFVAAHKTYTKYVHLIIKVLHDTPLENGNGEKLNMRTVVAFSKANRVARPSSQAGQADQQRALDKQREENQRAHQQALDVSDPAMKCLKDLERQQRRIERLIGLLEANEDKKHYAPEFRRNLDKLALTRLYVQIGYGDPKVLSKRDFRRRIARLSSGRLSVRFNEHLMDFEGNQIDRAQLVASANALEAKVRKVVGKDNTHMDPPPIAEIPKWLDRWLKDEDKGKK